MRHYLPLAGDLGDEANLRNSFNSSLRNRKRLACDYRVLMARGK